MIRSHIENLSESRKKNISRIILWFVTLAFDQNFTQYLARMISYREFQRFDFGWCRLSLVFFFLKNFLDLITNYIILDKDTSLLRRRDRELYVWVLTLIIRILWSIIQLHWSSKKFRSLQEWRSIAHFEKEDCERVKDEKMLKKVKSFDDFKKRRVKYQK